MKRLHKAGAIAVLGTLSLWTAGASAQDPAPPDSDAEPSQADLVFIQMEVDKRTAYQGEPILLTLQLWRIQNRRITTGPYRGGLIQKPSTEGFLVRELEPIQYEATRGSWTYDVSEIVRLLYPTRSGALTVGQWHWEGIALVNRQGVAQRDKIYYKFDTDPIDITVLPLPPAPREFTGAVGKFKVAAEVTPTTVKRGAPLTLRIRIEGFGNPDAIGDPVLPDIVGAIVREPERDEFSSVVSDSRQPRFHQQFTFSVAPLWPGTLRVPEFNFVWFNPVEARYETQPLGPFAVDVYPADAGDGATGDLSKQPQLN